MFEALLFPTELLCLARVMSHCMCAETIQCRRKLHLDYSDSYSIYYIDYDLNTDSNQFGLRLQNDWQSQFKNMWNFEYTNYVTLYNCNQFNSMGALARAHTHTWAREKRTDGQIHRNCNHAAYSNELNYLIIFSFQIMQNNIDWNEIGARRRTAKKELRRKNEM